LATARTHTEKRAALERKVKVVAIPRRLKDWGEEAMVEWQGFRAGIEGTISVLEWAFRDRTECSGNSEGLHSRTARSLCQHFCIHRGFLFSRRSSGLSGGYLLEFLLTRVTIRLRR